MAVPFSSSRHQSGVALVVVLVFMLALTGIALFSARNALFGEMIARNQLDAQVARQAAEAALRDAEADLMLGEGPPPAGAVCNRAGLRPIVGSVGGTAMFDMACSQGQCVVAPEEQALMRYDTASASGTPAEPWWPAAKGGRWGELAQKPKRDTKTCQPFVGGVPLGTFTGLPALAGVPRQPEYLIELVRPGMRERLFRITARGFGYSENAEVLVQSYFIPPSEL